MSNLGYDDTPILPGMPWRVHDSNRPLPKVVNPGESSTLETPSDAILLFDGSDLSGWKHQSGEPAQWTLGEGYMEVMPSSGDIFSEQKFGDCQLHVEWASPSQVKGDGQGRGNSGVFLMGLYEIQVLDSFENPTYADGIAAAVYGQYPPLVNASRPPGEWQTYDIFWQAPRIENGNLTSPAHVTVLHNGVLVHHHRSIQGPTQHKALANYDTPHDARESLRLQDHGDLVRFRNIWMRELKDYDQT